MNGSRYGFSGKRYVEKGIKKEPFRVGKTPIRTLLYPLLSPVLSPLLYPAAASRHKTAVRCPIRRSQRLRAPFWVLTRPKNGCYTKNGTFVRPAKSVRFFAFMNPSTKYIVGFFRFTDFRASRNFDPRITPEIVDTARFPARRFRNCRVIKSSIPAKFFVNFFFSEVSPWFIPLKSFCTKK